MKKEAPVISILIDDWEDLFDDFDSDPENFSTRTISDDFLDALESRYVNRKTFHKVEIVAPHKIQDKHTQKTVLARLSEQLRFRYSNHKRDTSILLISGAGFISAGLTAFFLKDLASFSDNTKYLIDLMCWLGMWEGANKIYDAAKEELPSLRFFQRIVKAEIAIVYK